MKLVSISQNDITVCLERDELDFLCNAINESVEALEEWEFHTRTGVNRSDAIELLAQLRRISENRGQTP